MNQHKKAYIDVWCAGLRQNLCQIHQNNSSNRVSYEYAVGSLEESAKFIADYHGRDTAVGVLDRLAESTLAAMRLPEGVMVPMLAPPPTKPDLVNLGTKRFPIRFKNTFLYGMVFSFCATTVLPRLIQGIAWLIAHR